MSILDYLFDESLFDLDDMVKYDFTKKEDVEKADELLKEMKETFGSWIFNDDAFDAIHNKIHEIYDNHQKELQEKEQKELPKQPMNTVPEKVKNNITNMAVEYFDTMIYPNIDNLDEQKRKNVIDALVDFSCWMYKK